MTFSIFFFFLLLKLIPADPVIKAWQITEEKKNLTEIEYRDKNLLNPKAIYLFARDQDDIIDIIYWTGPRSKQVMNIVAAKEVGRRARLLTEVNLYIIRGTSKKNIKKFKDLLSANVFEKTPRLYKVAGPHTIRQIQLKCDLINKEDSYVLSDGFTVTVYHSSTSETKRKVADSLAAYIVQVEYNKDPESSFDDEKNSEITLRTFCNKILNALQTHSKSKTDSISEGCTKNNKVNKKLSNKDIAHSVGDAYGFGVSKDEIFTYLKRNMVLPEPDSPRIDRILSTNTASGSSIPTCRPKGKKSTIDKGKTKSEKPKEISFLESVFGKESPNIATTSKATDSRDTKYENLIPIFLGSEECAPRTQPPLIDTLKSTCLYMLKDLENNELFIHSGKNSDNGHLPMALGAAEIDIYENPSVKLTILLEGNKIPTHFMIHIETEIRQFLTRE